MPSELSVEQGKGGFHKKWTRGKLLIPRRETGRWGRKNGYPGQGRRLGSDQLESAEGGQLMDYAKGRGVF